MRTSATRSSARPPTIQVMMLAGPAALAAYWPPSSQPEPMTPLKPMAVSCQKPRWRRSLRSSLCRASGAVDSDTDVAMLPPVERSNRTEVLSTRRTGSFTLRLTCSAGQHPPQRREQPRVTPGRHVLREVPVEAASDVAADRRPQPVVVPDDRAGSRRGRRRRRARQADLAEAEPRRGEQRPQAAEGRRPRRRAGPPVVALRLVIGEQDLGQPAAHPDRKVAPRPGDGRELAGAVAAARVLVERQRRPAAGAPHD